MFTQILDVVDVEEIKSPGKYIVVPASFEIDPSKNIYIVDVYKGEHGYLVYVPPDGQERVVATCGHHFYSLGAMENNVQ
jgi:hypothetical protein